MRKYCIHCNKEIDYDIVEKDTVAVVRGKNIVYKSQSAVCPNCNNELYVPGINDSNIDRIGAAYRQQEDIITVKEINDILEMYHVGKRPLSRLLGFGEITITRFLEGKLPTKKSSDVLKSVMMSTKIMSEIIEKNKDETLNSACEGIAKSIADIEKIKTASKIEQMAQYVIINLEDTTNMVVNKILHFSQVVSFMIYGKPLFDDESQVWMHGPVYPNIYQKYKGHKSNVINPIIKNDALLNISSDEKDILDVVITVFGCYTAATLRNLTHVENVWRENRKGLMDDENSERYITMVELKDYATRLKTQLEINSLDDIQKYCKHLRECEAENKMSIS